MPTLSRLEYRLIDETKCGKEPLFVLVKTVGAARLDPLLKALVRLVTDGRLLCTREVDGKVVAVSVADLQSYCRGRQQEGEDLAEPPNVGGGYDFAATDRGIALLKEKDRPIPLDSVQWVGGRAYQRGHLPIKKTTGKSRNRPRPRR